MTTTTIPAELQTLHEKLYALREPVEPQRFDTVKDSETAFEDTRILDLILYAIAPWWAEGAFEGGDESGGKDYLIGVPLAFVVTAAFLGFGTDFGGWDVFAMAVFAAGLTFIGLVVFHLTFHKYISMVIYNRVFRRGWVKKTRETDEAKYLEDVATYPQRLRDYEEERYLVTSEAVKSLAAYHAASPTQQYQLGKYGFVPVSNFDKVKNFAGTQARSMFGKLLNR